LLSPLAMALQRLGGEVMPSEHALDPAVIDGIVVAVPQHPRQFASGQGMGHGQPHDMLLDVLGQEDCRRRLSPCMRQGAPIDQPQEVIASKAPQIPPQPPIVDPGLLTLPPRGPLTFQNRANGLITGQGFRILNGVTDEEGELRRMGRVAGHRFLLHQQRSIQGLSEESMYTLCADLSEECSLQILQI
jgi:hypothetical protein